MKNESCDKRNLSDFTKGWLVGDFEPSIFKNKDCEVGIKEYKAGTVERLHVHNIVTEYTIILSGTVIMLEKEFILYKAIGIFRSSIFFALIFITLLLIVFLILLITFNNTTPDEEM